ncbi:hypothetical protein [Hymenobacter sp. IS2118]|uniref:hypothetical protein n=1 Tax=Hymenobacter sp. IS2118 TaxID=1505605 RepID=UPI000558DA02|nr:hypothetical protein [Hymenobacter sp. IS2118]
MRFQSYETTQLSGQLSLQLEVLPQAGQAQFALVAAKSSVSYLLQAALADQPAYRSLSASAATTVSIRLNYSPAQLPYYPVRVTATLATMRDGANTLINHDCYVYFTPYGSAEIWDVADYARLRRSWLVGNEATAPARLSVPRSAIPVSNIGANEEAGPQDYIGMRFVEGLAYAVPMRYASPTNSENAPPTDPLARDGCGLGQRRYRGRIQNVRVFTMHERDGDGQQVPIFLKNARVRVMRSVDVGPDMTIKQLYTDDQGFVIENGSRVVEFDHCSINTSKIQVYLSVELIDSPEKVRIKRSGAWYSWTRIETGRQQLSYSSTRQTLNFGTAVGGNREISLDPNSAGRTFTWIKWSKQLLQQELGAAANFTSTLAIKIEDPGEGAYYDRFTRNIHFETDVLQSEETAMHEFGHFAMHEMQRSRWLSETGGEHFLVRNNKHPNTTITEGFAGAFSYIMDEMTSSVLDQESGRGESGNGYHGRRRTQLYLAASTGFDRNLDLNHPFVSEDIFARTLLDLWDGPSNYARFNNTTLDDYTDGGNDTFEMPLVELFRPFYTSLIPDPVRFYNNLLLENTGANAARNAQLRDLWHYNFSATAYNVADFTILGTDEIGGSRLITHDRDDYTGLFNNGVFDKVETYSYQYIGTDIGVLNGPLDSYNLTTYIQDVYDTAGRFISRETKNANGVTLTDPLRITNGAELGLHSGAQPRWYNQSSGLTRYTKRTEHLLIALRAQGRLTVGKDSRLTVGAAAPYQTTEVSFYAGTYLVVEDGATLTIAANSTLSIGADATLLVRNGGNVVVDGELLIRGGGHICIEQGGNVRLSTSSRIYVDANARMGVPPGLNLPTTLACTNEVAACGRVEILNSGVRNTSGSSEALRFDGNDVVAIPNTNSYVNELGQVFGIEAYLRADNLSAPSAQTIFSSRQRATSGTATYTGVLFSLYGGRLLLQLDGRNYYSDNTMLPNDNGCHHVAVTRDAKGRAGLFVQYTYLGAGKGGGYFLSIPATNWKPNPVEAVRIATDSLLVEEGKTYAFKNTKGSPRASCSFDARYAKLDQDPGELTITRFDPSQRILSGRFHFVGTDKSTGKQVRVTDGRFDIRF